MKKYGLLLIMILFFLNGCANKTNKIISFAGSGGYPPFNYINQEGQVIGFDVDVAKEISKRMGKELNYITVAWDGIIEGLRSGRYNGILGSMAITKERKRVVDFSVPYYYSGAQLITRKDSDIKSSQDLNSKHTIGIVTGTTFEKDVKKLRATVRLYEDDNQTLIELLNNRIDGVITDRVVALNAIKNIQGGKKLQLTGSLLRTESCAIAFQKNDKLRIEVNKILENMHRDGTLSEISKKWFNNEDITIQ